MSAAEIPQAETRREREREFHDRLAAELEPARMPPTPPGELEAALLGRLGELRGRKVLELGCGAGSLTLELVERGATVTAIDLSPGMVRVAEARLRRFLPEGAYEFRVAPAEATGLPDERFDLVVGLYILHHLDPEAAGREIWRLLGADGRAVFLETSARNRLLMLARSRVAGRAGVPRYGTEDEHPLADSDISLLAAPFESVELDYPVFDFFRLFDRQVLRYGFARASRFLAALDRGTSRALPSLKQYSYRVLVVLNKGGGYG